MVSLTATSQLAVLPTSPARSPAQVTDLGGVAVEIRPALEPWPLICDTPLEGGFTSRFVDASLRRFEITISEAMREQGQLWLQGRPLPLADLPRDAPLLAVRYRHQRLYPCLHPALEPQLPLRLELHTPGAVQRFQLSEADSCFKLLAEPGHPKHSSAEREVPAWSGRIRPGDVTLDLRLG